MKPPESNFDKLNNNFETAELINKFLEGTLTPDESGRLERWISESEGHQRIWKRLTNPAYLEEHLQYWKDKDTAVYRKQLEAAIAGKQRSRRIIFRKSMRYAAILLPIILVCGAGWYFIGQSGKKKVEGATGLASVHIMPRGKVAQLILGNGQVVNLNDSLREDITEKDGTKVSSRASMLSYAPGSSQEEVKAIYNTLLIPRGGEYRVTLSDGTKVWLNAASSLRYPTRFIGKERKVFLSGEAYFEVATDAKHPFIVEAGKTDVTVLGTKFDISSYADDPGQKVTLAEGAVRVNEMNRVNKNNEVLLKPGYAAFIRNNEGDIRVKKADVEAVLAWKNGMFIFDGESLGSLMRKLSRWYNVDVKYDEGVDTLFHFTGRIQRYENITGILHLIELTGKVKFEVKGRVVKVKPYKEKTESLPSK